MIVFEKLELASNGKSIALSAHVSNESYYDNVYIKSIKVDTQDTFIDGGMPSSSAMTIAEYEDDAYVKSVDMTLTTGDLDNKDLLSNFFIFYIQTTGTPTPDVPCGKDNEYSIGAVYNTPTIYTQGLNLLKSLGNDCSVSPDIINFIAQVNGLNYALNTGNLPEAVEYWNSFFSKMKTPTITNKCCCHG